MCSWRPLLWLLLWMTRSLFGCHLLNELLDALDRKLVRYGTCDPIVMLDLSVELHTPPTHGADRALADKIDCCLLRRLSGRFVHREWEFSWGLASGHFVADFSCERLRLIEGLFTGELFRPEPPARIVLPMEIPARSAVRKADFKASAFRHGLVLDQSNRHAP
jgi:hypothetical protein